MVTVYTCFTLAYMYNTGPTFNVALDEPIEMDFQVHIQSLFEGKQGNNCEDQKSRTCYSKGTKVCTHIFIQKLYARQWIVAY